MPKPKKSVKAYKHKSVKRAHIPSAEEAGYEAASPKVTAAPDQRDFPRNPIVHRGQDPELFWMHKSGADDAQDRTSVDIRSLYRHEHIAPETLIKGLYRLKADLAGPQGEMFSVNELFGNAIGHEELDKVSDYYTHSDGWTNYWMLDDDYDGSNFVVRQVFFCGGNKDEFGDWRKGLSKLAEAATKKKAEQTLKIELDDEAFARIYGHISHPFAVKKGQKIAIRAISQFGEETTKVLPV